MLTASNGLSFIRAPLAFLFLQENSSLRIIAILLAIFTDSIDGYVARRNKSSSRFGTFLDPAADKFFVYFSIIVLFLEHRIAPWEMAAMLSRDFFVMAYGLLMFFSGRFKNVVVRAIRWGKVTTSLQFIVLIGLVLGFSFPWYIFATFIVMGWLGFLELLQPRPKTA
jgi:CDP-diacylglycerol--glycerol-3-phosphate 3-phosphatidyltransferase